MVLNSAVNRPAARATATATESGLQPKAPTITLPAKRSSSKAAGTAKQTPKKRKFDEIENDSRPPPQGIPPRRGDMCETLDYFRQYQGGIQTNDGFIRGSLLAHDNGDRPYVDDELILTRAGGGMLNCSDSDDPSSQYKQAKDHDPGNASIKSFLANVEYKIATPMILGQECKHCPAKPPYPYSVMDHFKAVYLWWEKSNNKKVARFRYEKFFLDKPSWWAPKGFSTRSGPPDYKSKAKRQICSSCKQEHPHIFNEGFICVNQSCAQFWNLEGSPLTDKFKLTYNQEWLAERTEWPAEIKPPFALRPTSLPSEDAKDPFFTTMRAALKGAVCPKCGCCISRKDFIGWFCETEGCGYACKLPRIDLHIRTIEFSHGSQYHGHSIPHFKIQEPFQRRGSVWEGPWRIETYDVLPGCLVKQFHSNEIVNDLPGGANDMLRDMTRADLGLKRRPMCQSVSKYYRILTRCETGADKSSVAGQLTNHYSANFGMPYKFSAEVETTPFDKAPDVIMRALHRMIWAGNKASENEPLMKLNELLVLGYFKDQQIGWHDDGEKALGPTIVTFSLGCNAKMLMRMKSKFFFGCTQGAATKYDEKQEVLLGCWRPEERHRLNANWSSWSAAEQAAEFKAFRKSYRGSKAPIALETELRHGDFIVMQGDDAQRCFDHQISNLGDVRFALTARHVQPKVLLADGYSESDLQGGEYETKESDVYTGDMNAFNGRQD
ncbi:MAG: hypothetical protein LQ343_001737 [Gyalolechia ehrenbergii]|nr:MAG: hypothetical protein LQ343_001737 [Gyalolechia ehrenbergii]